MTNLEALEKLRIPSDVTDEQIHELFKLAHNLSFVVARKKPDHIIQKRQDELTAWFMSQNLHHQIKEN